MNGNTPQDTFTQTSDHFIIVLQFRTNQTTQRTTIFFINDHIMRYVNQTTSQITSISSLQSCIGQTFTSTVSRDKILQHRQTFLKVRKNRVFNNLTTFCTTFLRFCHQTTHAGQLTNLFFRTTGSRIHHHIDRVETIIISSQLLHQCIGQLAVNMCPSINNLVITFVVGNEPHVIVVHNLFNFVITFFHQRLFFRWDQNVSQVEGQTTFESHIITQILDIIQELSRTGNTTSLDHLTDDITESFFTQYFINITDFFRNKFIDHQTPDRSFDHFLNRITFLIYVVHIYFDRSMDIHFLFIICDRCFFRSIENKTFTLCSLAHFGYVVQA